jgi:SAM-dependent methyltransferase
MAGDVKPTVRRAYAQIALADPNDLSMLCCGAASPEAASAAIGYSAEQMACVPDGANLGLGCGNPLAMVDVSEGAVVLDLGSGGGFDSFLAAQQVGAAGRAIGVDMTPEMLARARANAEAGGYTNVEFREGEIESLPVSDASVDLVISNCVINLSSDQAQVFREAFRALKPGGRIAISDTIQTVELPDAVLDSPAAKMACLSGAITVEGYVSTIAAAGFVNVTIKHRNAYPVELGFEEALAAAITEDLDVPRAVIEAAARSTVSLGVVAVKPLV